MKTRLNLVEKFDLIDDYRFKLRFKTPDVTYIPNRGGPMIVSKSYFDRVGEERFVKQPVGTGPYKFVHHVPGEYVDIERFEGYWGEKPSVKETRFYFVPEDTTRLAKLKAGEVDLVQNLPYPLIKDFERNPEFKLVRLATNHPTECVVFSNRNPKTPWYDRRVRLAMAYAIDCDAINKNVAHGVPNRWAYLAPGELGYDPSLKPYPYDPKRAKELLAEAGYPNGFEFKFYWPITGRHAMSREIAEAVAAYFEAIGLRPKLVGEEYAAFFARRRAGKAPDAEYVVCGTSGRAGAPDPTYYLDLFYSTDGGQSVYSNPEFDKIVAQTKATVDDTKRAELIKKAVRICYDDVAGIPIFSPVFVYAMKQNIDFKPTQKNAQDILLVKDITMR
jgi:peptide/nickel transport system substrate-binding protein